MKESVQIFSSPQFGEIRTAGTPEEPLFCLADVCKALELGASAVRQRLSDGVVSTYTVEDSLGRKNNLNFVTEDGLTRMYFQSTPFKLQAKCALAWR